MSLNNKAYSLFQKNFFSFSKQIIPYLFHTTTLFFSRTMFFGEINIIFKINFDTDIHI